MLIFLKISVTRVALKGRGLVENHGISVDESIQRVALVAFDAGMSAGEREFGALVVVKCGRNPALFIVTWSAEGFAGAVRKLAAVGFNVAAFAGQCGSLELNFLFARGHFVASAAGYSAMRADEREFRFGVIETIDVRPRFGAVAGFATEGGAIGAAALHAIAELPVMRIGVTGGAGAVFKMEWKNFIFAASGAGDVAIGTRNGDVSAGEWIAGIAMFRNGEEGAMPIHHRVATLAGVFVRSGGELTVMGVFVAIAAIRESHFVNGFFAGGQVALRAFNCDVLPFQGIFGSGVLFRAE